ncbi:uncharacterized protein LOC119307357 [Triticum dicoccoides]|uniref:uncharacterized protein LOC119307357 n=1 Tax=Triticum dicoccoides TaxID=85692 RepID=UPI00188E8758|nr:uncharacterized protein LOC119307357 [Triticum dicoccoides]
MQALARAAGGLWPAAAAAAGRGNCGQVQPSRGIVVQVRDGNLERALQVMERKMRSSGIERLIKRRTEHHVKNSEKRAKRSWRAYAPRSSARVSAISSSRRSGVSKGISQWAAFFSNIRWYYSRVTMLFFMGASC